MLGLAIAAGVVWSNALAYHEANLAPRERHAELEQIGEAIAGEGPTLMTEYEPYGVRHFLREADPEGAAHAALRELGRSGLADLIVRCCRHAHAIVTRIGALPHARAKGGPTS